MKNRRIIATTLAIVFVLLMIPGAGANGSTTQATITSEVFAFSDESQLIGTEALAFAEAKAQVAEAYVLAKRSGNKELAAAILSSGDQAATSQELYAIVDMAKTALAQNGAGNDMTIDAASIGVAPFSSSAMISSLMQCPQVTNTYCGFAALQSIIKYMGKSAVVKLYDQKKIRDLIYPGNPSKNNLDWFSGSNSQANDITKYVAAVFLRENTTYTNWTFMTHYTPSGTSPKITPSSTLYTIEYNIDQNRPVLVDGKSTGDDRIYSDYPNKDVSHWLVAYGYGSSASGSYINICDPAYGYTGDDLSFTLTTGYYTATTTKLSAYANRTGGFIY